MAEIGNLIDGYRRFHRKYFTSGDTLYQELAASGQSPRTLIIACSDSRVDPSILTDAKPGDIFAVRNVANLVPPYETGGTGLHGVSAALEFAVCVLKVDHVVVLGHSNCAGIHALLNPQNLKDMDFIGHWMDIAQPAKEMAAKACGHDHGADIQHACEQAAIKLSLRNLMTFPWIKKRVEEGNLKLHGWYFSIEDGTLRQYDPEKDGFGKV